MTDAPTELPSAAVPPGDPLARLHHMSNTAGVTTQEYVAINLPSVVTVILGMLSLVVLVFHQYVLLVVPAAAIVFGLTALSQIRNSNGTQWGRPLAWAGIVLAVLLGGGEVVQQVVQARAQSSDQQQVAQLLATLGDHLARGDDAAAYAMFTERFRERVPREKFDAPWAAMRKNVSQLKSVYWNGVPMGFQEDGSGNMMGVAMAVFEFSSGAPAGGRQQVVVRRPPGGAWEIDAIPVLFPEEKKRGGGGGPQ
jgi:hypothetical protein